MNTMPPAVTIGPPRLGEPHSGLTFAACSAGNKRVKEPSGTSHSRFPVLRSTATRVPKGGGVQGIPDGLSRIRRRMT